MSISALAVSWEAVYDDGHIYRESDGGIYGLIERDKLREFRLVVPGEILIGIRPSDGRTGWNLVYRRRTIINMTHGKQVWFIVGWVPHGPIFALQPETLQVRQAAQFEKGAGPLGKVEPRPTEGEHWTMTQMTHKTDVITIPGEVKTPSGYVMKGKN